MKKLTLISILFGLMFFVCGGCVYDKQETVQTKQTNFGTNFNQAEYVWEREGLQFPTNRVMDRK